MNTIIQLNIIALLILILWQITRPMKCPQCKATLKPTFHNHTHTGWTCPTDKEAHYKITVNIP